MSEHSDLELVFLSRQGDKAAFGQLVLRYQPMAQRLAIRLIGNRDLAQELVQDAMLQAYLSLEKLSDPNCFKSWLFGIVLNICRNDLRHRKLICFSLEAMLGNFVDEQHPIAGSSLDPQFVAEQEEVRTTILDAVDTLSPKNRSAILLFYHEQCSLEEVANRLNISVVAVKGRLHKSRHQLRDRLSPLQYLVQLNSYKEIQTMTTEPSVPAKPELESCSFCGKPQGQVRLLIRGPILETVHILICNECVDLCNKLIAEETPPSPLSQEEVEKLMDSGKLSD